MGPTELPGETCLDRRKGNDDNVVPNIRRLITLAIIGAPVNDDALLPTTADVIMAHLLYDSGARHSGIINQHHLPRTKGDGHLNRPRDPQV